jgi:hypothetical protein
VGDTGAGDWEMVWRGVAEVDASIIAGGLEADGIAARLQGARREHGLLAGSFDHGDYRVYVPGADAARARHLLRRRGEGVNVIDAQPDEYATSASAVRFVVIGLVVLAALTAVVYFANS